MPPNTFEKGEGPADKRPFHPGLRIGRYFHARERRTGAWYHETARQIRGMDEKFRLHLRGKGLANCHEENLYLVYRWEKSQAATSEDNMRKARNKHYLGRIHDADALREMLEEMDAMQHETTQPDANAARVTTNNAFDIPRFEGVPEEPSKQRRRTNPHSSVRFIADFGHGPVEVMTYDQPSVFSTLEITSGAASPLEIGVDLTEEHGNHDPDAINRRRSHSVQTKSGSNSRRSSNAASTLMPDCDCAPASSLSSSPGGVQLTAAKEEEAISQGS